jgi:hypothetical protein
MISRRGFLGWLGFAPLLGGLPVRVAFGARAPKNSVVVFDDITPQTNAAYLGAALAACAAAGVPTTCLIETGGEGKARMTPTHPVAVVLQEAKAAYGGLVEVCPFVGNLGELSPYFQTRAVFEAQQKLQEVLGQGGYGTDRRSRLVGAEILPEATSPNGLRSAGIRTVLMRPRHTTEVRSEAWDTGVVRIFGGVRLGAADRQIPLRVDTASEQIYYVSVGAIADSDLEKSRFDLEALITAIKPQPSNDWRAPVLAADVAFRDAYRYRRMLSLHLLLDEGDKGAHAFQSTLRYLEIPFTVGLRNADHDPVGTAPLWLETDRPARSTLRTEPRKTEGFFKTETRETSLSAESLQEAPVALWNVRHEGSTGLDRSNVLRLPSLLIDQEIIEEGLGVDALGANDLTLVVDASLLKTEFFRLRLKDLLLSLRGDGFTEVVPLDEQARVLLPRSPVIAHHRRTAAYRRAQPSVVRSAAPQTIDPFIEDAKVAWSYFEKWTNPKTGLCPATVHVNGRKSILHEAVTMWDVGSHINALIAAHQLELISSKAFKRAVDKIRPNLAGRRSQGRLLPQGWIVTDRIKWGIKDFDGCDAGRLLSSLYNLDTYGVAGKVAAPIVESWDLPEIIRDGVIYSVTDGEMVSTYKSHCAHYAAWAFKIWGMDALSPYERPMSHTDGEIALLEAAARIGPLGAEPLLLEALELEMSPESAFLADTLFAAQLEERRESGVFTCVSESPIDRSPWFVYSGLDLSREDRTWATDTVDSLPEHRSAEFAREHITVSTKAAYLWHAYNQHEYTGALIERLREQTKTKYGFRSGIYQSSGAATRNSDLNTNAVILQAIAKLASTQA